MIRSLTLNWRLCRNAPVMADSIETFGVGPANASGTWMIKSAANPVYNGPGASHPDKGGMPVGGNFLFEDGHVAWVKFDGDTNFIAMTAGGLSQAPKLGLTRRSVLALALGKIFTSLF